MLRYPLADRKTLTALDNLRIRSPNGIEAPLAEVATVELGRGYPTINRANRNRIINVQSSADKVVAKIPSIEQDLDENFIPALREKFPNLRFSFVGERKEQSESDSGLAQAGGISLFVIYALLAIPFRSYLQPFLIMSVIVSFWFGRPDRRRNQRQPGDGSLRQSKSEGSSSDGSGKTCRNSSIQSDFAYFTYDFRGSVAHSIRTKFASSIPQTYGHCHRIRGSFRHLHHPFDGSVPLLDSRRCEANCKFHLRTQKTSFRRG